MTPSPFVGRHAALLSLREQLASAHGGSRRVSFITGDTGIGKTTLCERFIRDIGADGRTWIGRGRCVKRETGVELFSTLVDALADMSSTTHEPLRALEQLAPSWLERLPGFRSRDVSDAAFRLGPGRERCMARELNAMLDVVAVQRTTILVVEDLQWADRATIELLSTIGRRAYAARILIVGTIRWDDVPVSGYELAMARVELRLRNRAVDVALAPFREGDVVEYLAARFANQKLTARLAPALHQLTAGNPRRLVTALERLQASSLLEHDHKGWHLHPSDRLLKDVMGVESAVPARRQVWRRHGMREPAVVGLSRQARAKPRAQPA